MWSILDRRRDAEALLGCDQVVVAVEPGVELRPFHGAVEAGVRARLVLADLACAHSRTADTATNGRGDWRARPPSDNAEHARLLAAAPYAPRCAARHSATCKHLLPPWLGALAVVPE